MVDVEDLPELEYPMRYYVTPSTLMNPRLLDTIDVVDLENGTTVVLVFSGNMELRSVDYQAVSETHPNLMAIVLKQRSIARASARFELHDIMEWGLDTQTKADRYALMHKVRPNKEHWQQLATELCHKVDQFFAAPDRVENSSA